MYCPEIERIVGVVTVADPVFTRKFVVEAFEENVFVPAPVNSVWLKALVPVAVPEMVWAAVPAKVVVPLLWVNTPPVFA